VANNDVHQDNNIVQKVPISRNYYEKSYCDSENRNSDVLIFHNIMVNHIIVFVPACNDSLLQKVVCCCLFLNYLFIDVMLIFIYTTNREFESIAYLGNKKAENCLFDRHFFNSQML
jgi:hypothetical protein